MKELERQALLADRETARSILDAIPDTDPLGRISFTNRLADIEKQLAELDATTSMLGSVALIFDGDPVLGSRAINSNFAASALHSFQDLVSKRVAAEESGKLGARGPVPIRSDASLSITNVVRGSFGFLLEESAPNQQVTDSIVKSAIEDVIHIIISTGSSNEKEFESAIESLDDRLLVSLRELFKTLDEGRASLRIVEGTTDTTLTRADVHRGRDRVDTMEITEHDSEEFVGDLLGLLPEARRFEMKLPGSDEIIKGSVSAAMIPAYRSSMGTPGKVPVGRRWKVKMRVREIRDRKLKARQLYTLMELVEPA